MIVYHDGYLIQFTMATSGRETCYSACEAFQKNSATLLKAIQDPEVLAWELYAENIISVAVREAANNMMHERGERASKLLVAVESQIAVDPGAFDVFLSVLAKRPSMSHLCGRIKDACSKSRIYPVNGRSITKLRQCMAVPSATCAVSLGNSRAMQDRREDLEGPRANKKKRGPSYRLCEGVWGYVPRKF